MKITTTDYHTGGEPFRIVTDVPPLTASTVAEKRVQAIADPDVDGLRRLLCSEPRGHADMYGGFLVEPDDDAADLGVLFWHKDGFSTACGHGTIALGAWAVNTGRVPIGPDCVTDVVIDVPSGRVTARVHTDDAGRVGSVDFRNVPGYVLHAEVPLETSAGPVTATVAFGGAIYAHVPASAVGLSVAPDHLTSLIALAREIKAQLAGTSYEQHPSDPRLSGTYGVIWYDDLGDVDGHQVVQRNVTVFADGEVDRSPCGSGTASRIAALAAEERLGDGQVLVHHSIVGSTFLGRIVERGTTDGHPSVTPVVTGTSYLTGEHVFSVDPADDLTPGFVLR